ncbi:MAG: prepilin-type N-terminal cleavage/methylation domain-containing protein [Colwelliaceae bacterium]|jgi:MSHA pilin protein MshA|nr:prepilin-type N-terminal cleavage/methylation domain-containing protein [Colwelliaceae bacterium]
MKKLTNTKGFTLIELVVVIVILGILAATAAPKFIDLTSDAKAAVMEGVEGSIESAVSMIHAKALVQGKATGNDDVLINGLYYAVTNGYPRAQSEGAGTGASDTTSIGIIGTLDIDTNDFTLTEGAPTIFQHGDATGTDCQLTYTDSAGAGQRPVIDSTSLATTC